MVERIYMEKAISLAKLAAAEGEVPVGAVVVKDGKIVGEGRNRREKEKTPLGHAEIEAVHNACRALGSWRLSDCELYVTLEPCSMCLGALIGARVSKIVFGAYDEKSGAAVSRGTMLEDFENKLQVFGGYMQKECEELLTFFFRSLR